MTLMIIDRIEECDDGLHQRRTKIQGITLHMFAAPGIHDAAGIARFYRMHPEWTGGQMPYTYVIHGHGLIEQALHLFEVGPHALRWSSPTIGVVHLGDFNAGPPAPDQLAASLDLVAELSLAYGLDPLAHDANGEWLVAGHTERPHATRSQGKNCPGKMFDLDTYRAKVAELRREGAVQRLAAASAVG